MRWNRGQIHGTYRILRGYSDRINEEMGNGRFRHGFDAMQPLWDGILKAFKRKLSGN